MPLEADVFDDAEEFWASIGSVPLEADVFDGAEEFWASIGRAVKGTIRTGN